MDVTVGLDNEHQRYQVWAGQGACRISEDDITVSVRIFEAGSIEFQFETRGHAVQFFSDLREAAERALPVYEMVDAPLLFDVILDGTDQAPSIVIPDGADQAPSMRPGAAGGPV